MKFEKIRIKFFMACGKAFVVCFVFAIWYFVAGAFNTVLGFILGTMAALFLLCWINAKPYEHEAMQASDLRGDLPQADETEKGLQDQTHPFKKKSCKKVPGRKQGNQYAGNPA